MVFLVICVLWRMIEKQMNFNKNICGYESLRLSKYETLFI